MSLIKSAHLSCAAIILGMFVAHDSASAANPTFAPPAFYNTGKTPWEMCSGHFNNDSSPDLAVLNQADSSVAILINNGDGTFASAVKYGVGYNLGLIPTDITCGDFNGDARDDLAVTFAIGGSQLFVLLNNGDGTFASPVGYNASGDNRCVATGLFNNDGILDLAAGTGTIVSVLIGSGTGTFAAGVNYPSGNPSGIATSDFDVDGKLDLAISNYNNFNFALLKGNGDGTFAPLVPYSTLSGNRPVAIAAVQLNADGKADVVTANEGGTVSIFINNGNGTFAAVVNVAASGILNGICGADFNGDSKTDLALSHELGSGILIYNGNGNGTLASPINFPVGAVPRSVCTADFNSDGKPDLAVANSASVNMLVLINTSVFTCCIGLTGNIDCDAGDGTDIADLAALIDYLYITFTPLCCPAEANTDGQPGVDIADLAALIDYLYISFAPTAGCQ